MLFLVILNKNKENKMKIEKTFFEITKNDEPIMYFVFNKNNKNTASKA